MINFTKLVTVANINVGFITAISTIAYVFFTIIIVCQSRIAARGWLFPSLAKIPGETADLMCLKIENPTNTPVKNAKITVCPNWLSQYAGIAGSDAAKNFQTLKQINTAKFTIMPKQAMFYAICVVPGKSYEELTKFPLKVTIKHCFRIGAKSQVRNVGVLSFGTFQS